LECGVFTPLLFLSLVSGLRQCFTLPHLFLLFLFSGVSAFRDGRVGENKTAKQKWQSEALPYSRDKE
jgi:hypothetical protein